jgi:hypothetical protein
MQHENIPVDFIDETAAENIEELNRYKVVYVTQPNVPVEVQRALQAWVEQGGHLVLTGSAASADCYDEPTELLTTVGHLRATPGERLQIRQTGTLPIVANVLLDQHKLPVAGSRSKLEVLKGHPLLAYADGSAAVADALVIKGKVTFFAMQPGVSYIRSFNGETADKLPVGYDANWRRLITLPLQSVADLKPPPVYVNMPLVETPVLRSDKGVAVTVLNWTGREQDLVLDVQVDARAVDVESVIQGPIKATFSQKYSKQGGGIQFSLPATGDVDIVMIRYK